MMFSFPLCLNRSRPDVEILTAVYVLVNRHPWTAKSGAPNHIPAALESLDARCGSFNYRVGWGSVFFGAHDENYEQC
jgi:hypothetical protein